MSAPIVHTKQIPHGSIRLNSTLARNVARVISDDIYQKTNTIVNIDMSRFPIDHPLIDKVIRRKASGDLFIVSRMYMMYDDGYYMVGLYEQVTGSSGQVNIVNFSCPNSYADPQIDQYDITDISVDDFFGTESREWYDRRKAAVADDIKRYAGVARMIHGNH